MSSPTPGAPNLDPLHLQRIVQEADFFKLVFDALPLQVAVKSTRPETFGQFLMWNRVAEQWLGLPAAEVIGKTDYDFFPREQADAFLARDREVVASRVPLVIAEEPIQSRTSGTRFIRTTKTPIYDDQGEPLALLAVSEDMTDRKHTARELESTLRHLRDERNLLQALLDHLPMCAFAKSARPENYGAYVLWNRVMEEMHGHRPDEALGRSSADIFSPETAAQFDRQDEEVLRTGNKLDIPLQSMDLGGAGWRLMHTVKAPVYAADGSPLAVIGVSEDVTERISAEAERTQAIEMLRQLNSRVPGAIYQLRIDTTTGRRRFSYVSERIFEIYGITAEEFMADHRVAQDCVYEEDRERVEAARLLSAADGRPFQCEFRIRRRDGELRWVQSSAVIQRDTNSVYWHGFIMDITARRLADEALRESEERWQLALAGSNAGVWDWNIRTGELFYSDRWREMFGFPPEELPRTPQELLLLIHPEDRETVRRLTRSLLRRETDLFRCEYRMCRSNGSYTWILAHAKAHFENESNRPRRMIGTLIDISHHKKVETQLVEAKELAENANRAKSDFLAMMSHEIRTPLNGVLGFAELLGGSILDDSQRECVQVIRESGSNLLHVLNDILDYSKIEAGKLSIDSQPAELRTIIAAAAETFRARAAAKKLELLVEIAPHTPDIVSVDALRLQQVLMNLISNAVKFTVSGHIRLAVEPAGVLDASGHQALRFIVADTGIGLSGKDLPRLFEPFEQHDVSMARRFGGTGLGLSIVRRLVDMMGGHIAATSIPGEGTTFTVDLTLPVPLPESSPSHPQSRPTPGPLSEAISILLVEDNPVNRRLARLMLERLGYAPDEAEDGSVAVEMAVRRHYDIILMDIQMPGMDGYEASRRILDESPGTRIVALTAHAMPADRERSVASGMREHLTKPVRIDELREALANCSPGASQIASPH